MKQVLSLKHEDRHSPKQFLFTLWSFNVVMSGQHFHLEENVYRVGREWTQPQNTYYGIRRSHVPVKKQSEINTSL